MRILYFFPVFLAFSWPVGARADEYEISEAKRNHWAWKKPARPAVPVIKDRAWVQNEVDAFLLAAMEAQDVVPAAPASRQQLIRRATFGLTGLPPSPAEIDAFLRDESPDAWAKVVDRLLASPHYGERWGRHWLDLARYADSNGYEFDEIRPDAWRYRDYVIASFNADKPYDRFILEQLAGDQLFPGDPQAAIATGFNLLGPDMTDSASQAQRRQNTLEDMTDTMALVFLGMTVGCARCHDHKFEPIPQADFFRLQAFFTPAVFRKDIPIADDAALKRYSEAERAYKELTGPLIQQVAMLEEPYRKKVYDVRFAKLSELAQKAHLTPPAERTIKQKEIVDETTRLVRVSPAEVLAAMTAEDKARHQNLQKALKKFDGKKPAPLPAAMGLSDGPAAKTMVLVRGELKNPGREVEPGFPVILSPGHAEVPAKIEPVGAATGRRAALARWIASKENPLTARVLVNRLWQHHFGRGIVATASDFGVRGKDPTHPELLDWLAVEFMEQGWSLKKIHRLLLLSTAYQQSTIAARETLEKDPRNDLFSRMNRMRLEGEAVRDSLLSIGGTLNEKMGGPGVFTPLPPETQVKDWKTNPDPGEHRRRSVYLFAKRNFRLPFLEAFDLPDSNLSCPKRERSTTAPQALALLNATEVGDAARALAARLEKQSGDVEGRMRLATRLVWGRDPSPEELALGREFLRDSPLSEFCRALFNANEFLYLD